MSRRRRTGQSRDGLFDWTAEGDVQAAEVRDNPRTRACPWCHAQPGEPCTRGPGRPLRTTYHDSRRNPAPQETR